MVIHSVEENAPAWYAGLRTGDTIMIMQGKEPCIEILNELLLTKQPGEEMLLGIKNRQVIKPVAIKLGARKEKRFTITELSRKSKLQQDIIQSWQKDKSYLLPVPKSIR